MSEKIIQVNFRKTPDESFEEMVVKSLAPLDDLAQKRGYARERIDLMSRTIAATVRRMQALHLESSVVIPVDDPDLLKERLQELANDVAKQTCHHCLVELAKSLGELCYPE